MTGMILETRITRLENGRKSRSGYAMRRDHAVDGDLAAFAKAKAEGSRVLGKCLFRQGEKVKRSATATIRHCPR
jgi:hypothetical protein